MSGELNSLTDLLKKTLFFFESLTVSELTPYVHKQILTDYTQAQVEEKISLCLEQHKCFNNNGNVWILNLEGNRDNDQLYNMLLKKQQPASVNEVAKNGSKKKKTSKILVEQAGLINDGRFIQLASGQWGLTEWEVETEHYSLKYLVIKALKLNPTGLSLTQLHSLVSKWRETGQKEISGILSKFPYFEKIGDGVWCYNPEAQIAYERVVRRYLEAIKHQKERWNRERHKWSQGNLTLQKQIEELTFAYRETAAALALRQNEVGRVEQMATQMTEKDLLLSLRKREIYRYKEHLEKLDAKANSILYQCRIWVSKCKNMEKDNARLQQLLTMSQTSQEALFSKLQQYKERERDNKNKLIEIKDIHANKVAELQTEIMKLKQKQERLRDNFACEQKLWRDEINNLSDDLKQCTSESKKLRNNLRLTQQDLNKAQDDYVLLKNMLANPLISLIIKLAAILKRRPKQVV